MSRPSESPRVPSDRPRFCRLLALLRQSSGAHRILIVPVYQAAFVPLGWVFCEGQGIFGHRAGPAHAVVVESACRLRRLSGRAVGTHDGGISAAVVSNIRRPVRERQDGILSMIDGQRQPSGKPNGPRSKVQNESLTPQTKRRGYKKSLQVSSWKITFAISAHIGGSDAKRENIREG